MPSKTRGPRPPLSPAILHILLALSRGDLHGLGIADEAARASDGVVVLGPGTLYRSLYTMRESGLVASVEAAAASDPRRKSYRITPDGLRLLQAELARLERLIDYAREKDVLAEGA